MPLSVSADALGVANGQLSLIDAEDCQFRVLFVSSSANPPGILPTCVRGSFLGRMTLLYSTWYAFHHISPCSHSWRGRLPSMPSGADARLLG